MFGEDNGMDHAVGNLTNDLIKGIVTKETILNKYGKVCITEKIEYYFGIACQKKDHEAIDDLIYLVFCFEAESEKLLDIFNNLIVADWHYKHEDIARLLTKYHSESSILYLKNAATMELEYLSYDGDTTFALAKKCIKALGVIGSEDSRTTLIEISKHPNKFIADMAKKQLN